MQFFGGANYGNILLLLLGFVSRLIEVNSLLKTKVMEIDYDGEMVTILFI